MTEVALGWAVASLAAVGSMALAMWAAWPFLVYLGACAARWFD